MASRYIEQSRKIVFSNPWLQISEATLSLPDGSQTKYLVFDNLPDAACILAINEHNQVMLNYEYSFPSDKYIYGFPAGLVETGETPEQTAHRELREESGLAATSMVKLGHAISNHRRSTALNHFFLATGLSNVPQQHEATELIESSWVDIDKFQEMIASGAVEHTGTLAAWGMYLNTQFKK